MKRSDLKTLNPRNSLFWLVNHQLRQNFLVGEAEHESHREVVYTKVEQKVEDTWKPISRSPREEVVVETVVVNCSGTRSR